MDFHNLSRCFLSDIVNKILKNSIFENTLKKEIIIFFMIHDDYPERLTYLQDKLPLVRDSL